MSNKKIDINCSLKADNALNEGDGVKMKQTSTKRLKQKQYSKEMSNLISNIRKNCSPDLASNTRVDISSDVEVGLKLAIDQIKLQEEESMKIIKEKEELKMQQSVMFKKLVSLLKENCLNNDQLPSLQKPTGKEEARVCGSPTMKLNFLGFRHPFPVYRNKSGVLTAESLLSSSPPSSPSPDGSLDTFDFNPTSQLPCLVPEDVANMNFVFKPVVNLLPYNNHLRNSSAGENKKKRKQTTKKKTHCKTIKQEKVTSLVEGKKIQNNGKIKLIKNKAKVTTSARANSGVKRKEKVNVKIKKTIKRNCTAVSLPLTINSASPQKPIKDLKKSSPNKGKKVKLQKQGGSPKKSPSSATKALFVPRKPKRGKNQNLMNMEKEVIKSNPGKAIQKTLQDKGGSREAMKSIQELRVKLLRTASQSAVPKINSSNLSPLSDTHQKSSTKKRKINSRTVPKQNSETTVPPVNKVHKISENTAKWNNQENVFNDMNDMKSKNAPNPIKVNNKYPAKIKKDLEKENPVRISQFKNMQYQNLYYPVHPFTSPDLPIHFIPVDPDNIPDFLPLFSPTVGNKGSSQVFPSFVQVTPAQDTNAPMSEYIFSKAIHSKSIPRQTLPAEQVIPRVLTGIASTSKSPLLPGLNTLKNLRTNSTSLHPAMKNRIVGGVNIEKTPSEQHRLVQPINHLVPANNIAGMWNNKPKLNAQQPLDKSSPQVVNVQQKVHYCAKCNFQTQKLGVLKRHELSHNKPDSPPDSTEEVLILDTKIHSKMNPSPIKPTILSSVRINTTQAQVWRANSTPSIQPSEDNDIGIKIVSTESLKECSSDKLNNFSGFLDSSSNGSLQKMFPSVTITPLLQPYDD